MTAPLSSTLPQNVQSPAQNRVRKMGGNSRIGPIGQNGITASQDSSPGVGICRALTLSGLKQVPNHRFFPTAEQTGTAIMPKRNSRTQRSPPTRAGGAGRLRVVATGFGLSIRWPCWSSPAAALLDCLRDSPADLRELVAALKNPAGCARPRPPTV